MCGSLSNRMVWESALHLRLLTLPDNCCFKLILLSFLLDRDGFLFAWENNCYAIFRKISFIPQGIMIVKENLLKWKPLPLPLSPSLFLYPVILCIKSLFCESHKTKTFSLLWRKKGSFGFPSGKRDFYFYFHLKTKEKKTGKKDKEIKIWKRKEKTITIN